MENKAFERTDTPMKPLHQGSNGHGAKAFLGTVRSEHISSGCRDCLSNAKLLGSPCCLGVVFQENSKVDLAVRAAVGCQREKWLRAASLPGLLVCADYLAPRTRTCSPQHQDFTPHLKFRDYFFIAF